MLQCKSGYAKISLTRNEGDEKDNVIFLALD
jgi:hypothetical protein